MASGHAFHWLFGEGEKFARGRKIRAPAWWRIV
jgi:hypothetical protein